MLNASPPHPAPPDPEIGALLRMWRDPLKVSTQLTREYGDVVRLNLGLGQVFLISHPDHAQYILRDHATNFTKHGGMWDALRLLGGDGVGNTDGDVWLRQRRMMQPLFLRERLANLTPLMTAAIAESLPPWYAAAAEAKPFDLARAMDRVTMHLILRTICSADIGDHEIEEMSEAVACAFRYIWIRMWTYFLPEWLPLPGKSAFREALSSVDRIVYGIVRRRRRHPDAANDLLSMLFSARDEITGQGMSDRQVRDEVVGFYVAGYETTATALTWCLYLLCQSPAAERKVRDEIHTVLEGRTPEYADLGRLTYTRMVFQEALRLYPPGWIIPRRTMQDDEIGGVHIPKNSVVALHFYAIQRHPKIWSHPDAFEPERFASEINEANCRRAYLPFGAGAHQCIGSRFAMMEGQLALAMLLQRFRFQLCSGHKVELDQMLVLRSRTGIMASLRPLHKQQEENP